MLLFLLHIKRNPESINMTHLTLSYLEQLPPQSKTIWYVLNWVCVCVLQGVASLVAQLVKNLPAMQGTPVPFLVREDPLECVCMCVCWSLSSLWLCDPMVCSPPGSSVHVILQATILEWVAMPPSGGSSWIRDQTPISYLLHWQMSSLPLIAFGKS